MNTLWLTFLFSYKHCWSWKVSDFSSLFVAEHLILVTCGREVTIRNVVSCDDRKHTSCIGTTTIGNNFSHLTFVNKHDSWSRGPLQTLNYITLGRTRLEILNLVILLLHPQSLSGILYLLEIPGNISNSCFNIDYSSCFFKGTIKYSSTA